MPKYFATPTDLGTTLIANAVLLGQRVNVVDFALGDGGGSFYLPTKSMTELRNEVWRTGVSHGEINPASQNRIDFFAVVPPDVGGFTIREMGLFDDKNNLIAVCNTPDIEKVTFDEGVSYDSLLSISLAVLAPEVLEYKVDPHIIIATKKDIENHNLDNEAHPHLRGLLDAHNAAGDSHPDIQAELLNKANKASTFYNISSWGLAGVACAGWCAINDFGVAVVVGDCRISGSLQYEQGLMQIPIGFRPRSSEGRFIATLNGSALTGEALLRIHSSGYVDIISIPPNSNCAVLQIMFLQ